MASFESLFPTFLLKCVELHELLRIVAFMLFIVGTITFVAHGFSGKTLLLHMVRLFILTALLVFLPQWGNQIQSLVQTSILNGLGVDPSNVQDQYNQLLVVKRDTTSGSHSWWDILGDMPRERLERSVVLNEVRELDRQQRIREGILKQINRNPELKQAYDLLVKDLPEDQKETVIAQIGRTTRRAVARAQGQQQQKPEGVGV